MAQGGKRVFVAALLIVAVLTAIGAQACLAADEGGATKEVTVGDKMRASGAAPYVALAAAIAVGLSGIAAGIAVGRVGAAALGLASERPELLMKSLIFVVVAEGIAIYGLLVGVLLWLLIR